MTSISYQSGFKPFNETLEEMVNSLIIGPFGRPVVVQPETLFDSKLITADINANFWSEAQLSGSGTTTSYNQNTASVTMSVGANTAGVRARQSKMRFNYQPGKGQQVIMTGVWGAGQTGITKRIGYFDANNGLFFQLSGTTLSVVRRTSTSGSPVDNAVNQVDWNLDRLDGTGASGKTLDLTKTQIMIIEFEWLGVGRVRYGFDIDGIIIFVHELLNANNLTLVYMSNPNLPTRYEIQNDGTGGASSLMCICSTVISLGGTQIRGISFSRNTGATAVTYTTATTTYPAILLQLKSGSLGTTLITEAVSVMGTSTNDDYLWDLRLNPTITGTFTPLDYTGSSVQTVAASGTTAVTCTGGTILYSAYGRAQTSQQSIFESVLRPGADINDVADQLALCITPLGASLNAYASLSWKELV